MEQEFTVSGYALLGESLETRPVTLVIKSGIITRIEDEPHPPGRWIVPAFFNAHTHLADTIAMDVPSGGDLESLVTPPDGLKHRMLRQASGHDLVSGIRASARTMLEGGTAGCADFREGGPEGVRIIEAAARLVLPDLVVFGRDGGEAIAEGLGISSARDVPDVDARVAEARKHGKLVAFHAGEKDPSDIDSALSYSPDLLIHCTHASHAQLKTCADQGIPIAICPRSNWALGVTNSGANPPVHEMIELGCRVLLGTDNAMFVQPDMFSEMSFACHMYHVSPEFLLGSAISGSSLTGNSYFIHKGSEARFFVLDPGRFNLRFSHDIRQSIAKRGFSGAIVKKVFIFKS